MADLVLVAVRDRATDSFGTPFAVNHAGSATRSFGDEVRNPESVIGKHPDDYDLYHVGDFDFSTGVVTPVSPPVMLAIGKSFAVQQS